ncbi:TonB-dependent receptor [Asticcacaulis sp. AND118]|uniref:TonB-dependent receptor n=1 Tax=Asticcacaulis sp. AND118 TaxID=2840468 RepID=UPI001CFFA020|nr:TonB-dependent receptor [Asticcacaulis sp. AND118]UDF03323.1 TonB-dependent receptor [Asticcacaulis sp. AND118]
MKTKSNHSRTASAIARYSVSVLALMATGAMAQETAPTAQEDVETVVVTGFRNSLQSSISEKRRSNDMVDVIKSDDIAQFPDLNLAESLQRVPGVAIDRDGGEGRTITVRGLNSEFTRVRLNELEALATAGGKDVSGGANRGRGFDFNVFAAELFNSLTVRKSLSAEIEEGSLGATVDLRTARPFDYKGFTMAGSGQLGYNDLSKDTSPRGTFLVSNRWADGKLGALLSVAYGERMVNEEGPNTTRWENAYSASNVGRFERFSTDGGTTWNNIAACTNANAACNTTETHSTNPALTGEAQKISRAMHPRIPRYSRLIQDQKRLGVTGAFQMRPFEGTLITLDAMYASFESNRQEYEIEAISFSRNGQGLPKTDVYNYEIDSQGTMVKGTFNDVDVRAEQRFDELKTTFKQLNLTWEQDIGEKLKMKVLVGASNSLQDNPEQTTFTFDAYDVQGYSYDFTDKTAPKFNYGTKNGFTPDQAGYWSYTPNTTATNPAASAALGDASLIRIRPQSVENKFSTTKIDFNYDLNDVFKIKFGASSKKYDFQSIEWGRYTSNPNTRDEAAHRAATGTSYSAGLVNAIQADLGKYAQSVSVAGNTFLIPNLDLIRSTFGYDCRCTNQYGTFTVNTTNSSSRANNREAHERDETAYIQLDFNTEFGAIPVRGNIGVRKADTNQRVSGYIGKGTEAILTTIERSYSDTLPALNVVVEPVENIFVRFAAAKTMARPTLASLSPGGSITTSSQTLSIGNPYLDPVRANTMDLSFEWYPNKDTLFTVGFFEKDIKSYIQNLARVIPFSETGFGEDLLAGTGQTGATSYTVTQPVNTPGGKLKGYEVSLQLPFTFLPGFLSHTGGVFNYTHVESKINYVVSTSATATTYRRENLLGLSPESYNVTFYYEDEKLSARVATSYRAGYLVQLNPGSGADFSGKNETLNVDTQITYKVNKHFTVVLEGINLTDEYDDRYVSYNTAQGNTANDLLLDYSHPGRQYYLGFRYKY